MRNDVLLSLLQDIKDNKSSISYESYLDNGKSKILKEKLKTISYEQLNSYPHNIYEELGDLTIKGLPAYIFHLYKVGYNTNFFSPLFQYFLKSFEEEPRNILPSLVTVKLFKAELSRKNNKNPEFGSFWIDVDMFLRLSKSEDDLLFVKNFVKTLSFYAQQDSYIQEYFFEKIECLKDLFFAKDGIKIPSDAIIHKREKYDYTSPININKIIELETFIEMYGGRVYSSIGDLYIAFLHILENDYSSRGFADINFNKESIYKGLENLLIDDRCKMIDELLLATNPFVKEVVINQQEIAMNTLSLPKSNKSAIKIAKF